MEFFSRLRIGRRLGMAFAVMVALTVASAVFSQLRLGLVTDLAAELAGEQAERSALAHRWRENIAVNSARALSLGMTTDVGLSVSLTADIKASSEDTSKVQKRFEVLETTAEGKALQKSLAEVRQRYLAARDDMLSHGPNDTSISAAIAKGQAVKAFGEICVEYVAAVQKLVDYEQQRAASDGAAIVGAAHVTSLAGLACAGVSVLCSIGLGLMLTRSIVVPVRAAQEAADRIAAGDLTGACTPRGNDEAALLTASLGHMQDALAGIVRDIRSSTASIQVASAEVASGNQDLSLRTEQTASNLQQAASSMEQLTATVRHSADSATEAHGLVATASEIAQRGGKVVSRVVATMDEIDASSRKISDIIGVIDAIAFQTNILALNAAVEAARAGEQGRGFAVVAGEVRGLAKRSAEAAREIKALIGTSVGNVENGTRLVHDAGATMTEIVDAVGRVSAVIGEITTVSGEQAGGIRLVTDAVNNVDQMTQQNSALVEESAAAAQSMRDQAARLAKTVEQFRTR